MIKREELAAYLEEYLNCSQFEDYAPNGIQIEGRAEIRQICTAVTASEDAIQKAVSMQADLLLVHHGYFWRGEERVIQSMQRRRMGLLFAQNMNLFAYHLPLDCHAEIGNNVCLGKRLKLQSVVSHTAEKTPNLLWSGELPQPKTAEVFSEELNAELNRKPLWISGTDKPIQRIAWCTGAAQDLIEQAHHLGVDAYLSGEISERTYYQARELGLHYFACGHHATERYGIQALGDHLSVRFGIKHQFIDSENPV